MASRRSWLSKIGAVLALQQLAQIAVVMPTGVAGRLAMESRPGRGGAAPAFGRKGKGKGKGGKNNGKGKNEAKWTWKPKAEQPVLLPIPAARGGHQTGHLLAARGTGQRRPRAQRGHTTVFAKKDFESLTPEGQDSLMRRVHTLVLATTKDAVKRAKSFFDPANANYYRKNAEYTSAKPSEKLRFHIAEEIVGRNEIGDLKFSGALVNVVPKDIAATPKTLPTYKGPEHENRKLEARRLWAPTSTAFAMMTDIWTPSRRVEFLDERTNQPKYPASFLKLLTTTDWYMHQLEKQERGGEQEQASPASGAVIRNPLTTAATRGSSTGFNPPSRGRSYARGSTSSRSPSRSVDRTRPGSSRRSPSRSGRSTTPTIRGGAQQAATGRGFDFETDVRGIAFGATCDTMYVAENESLQDVHMRAINPELNESDFDFSFYYAGTTSISGDVGKGKELQQQLTTSTSQKFPYVKKLLAETKSGKEEGVLKAMMHADDKAVLGLPFPYILRPWLASDHLPLELTATIRVDMKQNKDLLERFVAKMQQELDVDAPGPTELSVPEVLTAGMAGLAVSTAASAPEIRRRWFKNAVNFLKQNYINIKKKTLQWNTLGFGVAPMVNMPKVTVATGEKVEHWNIETDTREVVDEEKTYNVQPVFAAAVLQKKLREMDDFLEQNPMSIVSVMFQEDLYTGEPNENYGTEGDADENTLSCHKNVELLEGYWTRMLRTHGYELASIPQKSYHQGLPPFMRNKLVDHEPAAQKSEKEVFTTDPLFHSELPEGRKLLMGNTVYVKFGAMLREFCEGDLVAEAHGWNGAMEHYPPGLPRRSAAYYVAKCQKVIRLLTEGASHLSGGKMDDEDTFKETLSGAYHRKHLWAEGHHGAAAGGASSATEEHDEEEEVASKKSSSSSSGHGSQSQESSPWKRYHTTPRHGGVRPEVEILSPTANGSEMHFRGAGTLQRAQVRVFGEKLAAEGAPAVILGFDANSKTHMEYVHWVYQNFLFKKEYENMVPTMKEELQNFSVGQKYDEEVQELFLEQMPNLKRIAP